MKANNEIDELFRSKLKAHRVTPDADLKEAFLLKVASQNQKRKVIPIWYYASAAVVLIALGFFMISNNDNKGSEIASTEMSRENTSLEVKTPVEEEVKGIASIKTVPTKVEPSPIQKKRAEVDQENLVAKATNIAVPRAITKPADIPSQPSKNTVILDEVIPDELTIAYLESEKKENTLEESTSSPSKDLFQKNVGETVVIIAADPLKEEIIFIPEVSEDSNLTLAQATEIAEQKQKEDKSFIAKVFTEIKHLKHGEKVDVNTFASNISSPDGFIGHEAEEFKDRWNWIKNRVSKK